MEVFSDSKLIVSQVKEELEARDARMQEYLSQVRHVQIKFESFDLSHIPRGEYPCRFLGNPCHLLGTEFAAGDNCRGFVHPYPNKEGLAPDSSSKFKAELDGPHTAIP